MSARPQARPLSSHLRCGGGPGSLEVSSYIVRTWLCAERGPDRDRGPGGAILGVVLGAKLLGVSVGVLPGGSTRMTCTSAQTRRKILRFSFSDTRTRTAAPSLLSAGTPAR